MSKGYILSAYREINDPEKLAAYGALAGPAVEAAGGRFLARGGSVTAHEHGLEQRTVVIEFDSYEAALQLYASEKYKEALAVLGDAVIRDFRVVEGV
jgi:uncharacterized protein (DUF1330 family)